MSPMPAMRRRIVGAPHPIIPGSVITSDRFSGANVTNIRNRALDLGLGGSAKTWTQMVGTTNGIGITSEMAVRSGTGNARRYNLDAGTGNVYTSVKIVTKPTQNFLYMVVRGDGNDGPSASWYGVRFSIAAAQLFKSIGGTLTGLGLALAIADGTTVGIKVEGSDVALYANGLLFNSVTDTSIPDTNHGVGFQHNTTGDGFVLDDYLVANVA